MRGLASASYVMLGLVFVRITKGSPIVGECADSEAGSVRRRDFLGITDEGVAAEVHPYLLLRRSPAAIGILGLE